MAGDGVNGQKNYAFNAQMQALQAQPAMDEGGRDRAPEIAVEPADRDVAVRVMRALHELQAALDAAALAGLVIVPSFKSVPDRFKDRGNNTESYVARVEVYRKLV